MKEKFFKISNIAEPIILLISSIGIIYTTIFAFSNVNWVALGGKLREWYWYENLTFYATFILLVILLILEIINFILVRKKYKIYILVYMIIDIIISCIVWLLNPFAMLISIYVFCLIKCIYRFMKRKEILK